MTDAHRAYYAGKVAQSVVATLNALGLGSDTRAARLSRALSRLRLAAPHGDVVLSVETSAQLRAVVLAVDQTIVAPDRVFGPFTKEYHYVRRLHWKRREQLISHLIDLCLTMYSEL